MTAFAEWALSPLGFLSCALFALAIVCGTALILVARHGLRLEDEGPPETHP